jgi:hypothetical protein
VASSTVNLTENSRPANHSVFCPIDLLEILGEIAAAGNHSTAAKPSE